jgi:hypothetical protein
LIHVNFQLVEDPIRQQAINRWPGSRPGGGRNSQIKKAGTAWRQKIDPYQVGPLGPRYREQVTAAWCELKSGGVRLGEAPLWKEIIQGRPIHAGNEAVGGDDDQENDS